MLRTIGSLKKGVFLERADFAKVLESMLAGHVQHYVFEAARRPMWTGLTKSLGVKVLGITRSRSRV